MDASGAEPAGILAAIEAPARTEVAARIEGLMAGDGTGQWTSECGLVCPDGVRWLASSTAVCVGAFRVAAISSCQRRISVVSGGPPRQLTRRDEAHRANTAKSNFLANMSYRNPHAHERRAGSDTLVSGGDCRHGSGI